jgi:hypothetical protein
MTTSSSSARQRVPVRSTTTDPAEADATTVVQNLLYGRYGQPLRVVALNVDEGWSQDVSEAMARKVLEIAEREDYELTEGMLQFLEAHSPPGG